jgi:hypothetical protein
MLALIWSPHTRMTHLTVLDTLGPALRGEQLRRSATGHRVAWRCSLRRRGRSATRDQTVCDLTPKAAPSLCRSGRSTLWVGQSTMAQGCLPPCWNLDLTPWGRDLMVLRSACHSGLLQTTLSRLWIKKSNRGRDVEWSGSCPREG